MEKAVSGDVPNSPQATPERERGWKKARRIFTGFGFKILLDYGYDWLIYPLIMWYFGTWLGGLIAAIGAMTICFTLLMFYERQKKDWLGAGTLDEVLIFVNAWIGNNPKGIFRLISWGLKNSKVFSFFFMSIFRDPFETLVFLRRGRFEQKLNWKDYGLFFLSGVIGNIYWIFRTEIHLLALRAVFQ